MAGSLGLSKEEKFEIHCRRRIDDNSNFRKDAGTGRFEHCEELAAFGTISSRGGTPGHERKSADFLPEREMYFDMDIALPLHWESLTGKGHKLSKSTDSQDFEFNMSGNPDEPVDKEISPADDLFYKGQLLPLHLPKRLQMVQKLSTPKQTSPSSSRDKGDSSGVTVSCFFQPSSLKYSALGMDDSYLGSALVNSRSSSFHSQGSNNFWESDSPGDVDTGDSSSSRDSSGSSQDACVPDKQSEKGASFEDHVTYSKHCTNKEKGFFHQREFFSNHNLRADKSLFSSWLRSPFKWKVLFSLRRNSKSRNESSSKDSVEETNNIRACTENQNKKKLPREAAPPLEGFPSLNFSRSSRPSSSHSFSCDQKAGSSGKELFSASFSSSSAVASDFPRNGLFIFPSSDGGALVKEKFETSERSLSTSKARESLQKYLNILKPLNGRGAQRTSDTYRVVDIRATTFSGNLTSSPKHTTTLSAGLPSPKTSFAKSMSSPKASFSDKRSPVMHSLSGNLRVPSFSRSSKASINAGNAARAASPSHSGVLPNSPSAMAELHSAIQGAIAHCKQSQAAKGDSK